MKLLSWNIGGRIDLLGAQLAAITARQLDLVCLQEVRMSTAVGLRAGLRDAGLIYSVNSFDLAPDPSLLVGPRQCGELIACRWPIDPKPASRFAVPWTERILSCVVSSPGGHFETHTVLVPPGAGDGWTKTDTLNGLFQRLAVEPRMPRILCGDLNTPPAASPAGEGVAGQPADVAGELRPVERRKGRSGGDWDAGERRVLEGLARFDLIDVFRQVQGLQPAAKSAVSAETAAASTLRHDHVLASKRLCVRACVYLHALRAAGLSDHAPMEAEFDFSRVA